MFIPYRVFTESVRQYQNAWGGPSDWTEIEVSFCSYWLPSCKLHMPINTDWRVLLLANQHLNLSKICTNIMIVISYANCF